VSHYKPYPEYRDSGVEWIARLPKDWARAAIKHVLATPITDGPHETPAFLTVGIEFLSVDGIQDGELVFDGKRFISHDDHARYSKKAKPQIDDVLVGKSASVGKVARVKTSVEFNVWSPLAILRSNTEKCRPAYLEFALKADPAQQQILLAGNTSTQANIGMDRLGSVGIPIPPIDEQDQLTQNIERETKRIDSLITNKTRFIELLKEKRQALITHAVTKGLNPNVKFRDSGVEWIGAVPDAWSFQPIKFLASIGNGSTPTKDNNTYWENGHFPWLTSSCVNQDLVNSADQFVTDAALRECHLPVIVPPAVLIGITGQGKTRGMASTLLIEATINQHIAYLKPKPQILLIEFLRMFLDASYGWLRFESEAVGSTKGAITCEQLGNTKIPLPSLVEQQNILDGARQTLSLIDRLSKKTQHSIDLLKERRSAFITAAVTGQIDLREPA
jgi:type I restriction enzyme S subunit